MQYGHQTSFLKISDQKQPQTKKYAAWERGAGVLETRSFEMSWPTFFWAMSKQKSYLKLRKDEEESFRFIQDDVDKDGNFNLHSLDKKERSATSSPKLSRRQIIALASFVGVAILVVVTVSVAVTGKNESEGNLFFSRL